MQGFKFKIADLIVECCGASAETEATFSDYRVEKPAIPEYVLEIDRASINRAIEMVKENPLENLQRYTFGDFERVVLYEKLSKELAGHGILLMHGSVIAVDGEAFLFTARSGTGKSTHRAFWQELLGERAVIINDDKPFIKTGEQEAIVYGSPLCGKEGINTNCSAKLTAICLLERGDTNSIREISFDEALPEIMPRINFFKDPVVDLSVLESIDRLGKSVRFYRMQCMKNVESAAMSYNAMRTR